MTIEKQHNISAKEFIQRVFIDDVKKMMDSDLYHLAFVVMAQGIETLGSFLDSKPLKAKDQSKLRFSHAINKLMPKEYRSLNDNHKLYDQLRASLAHTFTTSRHIILTSTSNSEFRKLHLKYSDEKLVLVAEKFYEDFKKACLRLFDGMDKGIIHEKKINEPFYFNF